MPPHTRRIIARARAQPWTLRLAGDRNWLWQKSRSLALPFRCVFVLVHPTSCKVQPRFNSDFRCLERWVVFAVFAICRCVWNFDSSRIFVGVLERTSRPSHAVYLGSVLPKRQHYNNANGARTRHAGQKYSARSVQALALKKGLCSTVCECVASWSLSLALLPSLLASGKRPHAR